MKFRFPLTWTVLIPMLCVFGFSSCRKSKAAAAAPVGKPLVVEKVAALETNNLAGLPGAVYQSQAGSPIHWQPWTKETMNAAKRSWRLLFCVIALPQQTEYLAALKRLSEDSDLVSTINRDYVPVLIDGDASREMGILTADLCTEVRQPLRLPLFIWLTHEGNPMAWLPVGEGEGMVGAAAMFRQSHSMVYKTWEEDLKTMVREGKPSYVLGNSAMDNAARRERIQSRKMTKSMSEQPAVDVLRSMRQLASLYDPYTRSFDETGGLFPAGAMETLAMVAMRPWLPDELKARCRETTRYLLDDLLPSAMFDPLDGGVFNSRRGVDWELPSFIRDCSSQARAAVALLKASKATGNKRAQDQALALLGFAEKEFMTQDGLFCIGLTQNPEPLKWMWTVEEVEKTLGPQDAPWWIKATRMKGLGNLPSESDPRREFFRSNSLGWKQTPAETAMGLGMTPEEFAPRLEAAKTKLLAVRTARIGAVPKDTAARVTPTLRMVCAYAEAYSATGDEVWRKKAVDLLGKARTAFSEGPHLKVFTDKQPATLGEARAFVYGLALQAALDVHAITLDDAWLDWSEDLATTAAEMFTGNGFLKECPDDARLIDLPITDLVMLFDDSTAGMVSSAECRLDVLGRPLVASFSELATPLPTYTVDRPVLHTDLLQATVMRHFPSTVLMGKDLPAELKSAVSQLPPRSVVRRNAKPGEEVPAGAVKVLLPDNQIRMITTAHGLREAVLPSGGK